MQNIRKVRSFDGVYTVYADPGLIVSGLSEDAAEAMVTALQRQQAPATASERGGRKGRIANTSQSAKAVATRGRAV